MEEKDKKEECCETSGGGCGSGGCGKGCCAGKAAFALILLLIGGLIGFALGRGSFCHKMMASCPMGMGAPGASMMTK